MDYREAQARLEIENDAWNKATHATYLRAQDLLGDIIRESFDEIAQGSLIHAHERADDFVPTYTNELTRFVHALSVHDPAGWTFAEERYEEYADGSDTTEVMFRSLVFCYADQRIIDAMREHWQALAASIDPAGEYQEALFNAEDSEEQEAITQRAQREIMSAINSGTLADEYGWIRCFALADVEHAQRVLEDPNFDDAGEYIDC